MSRRENSTAVQFICVLSGRMFVLGLLLSKMMLFIVVQYVASRTFKTDQIICVLSGRIVVLGLLLSNMILVNVFR